MLVTLLDMLGSLFSADRLGETATADISGSCPSSFCCYQWLRSGSDQDRDLASTFSRSSADPDKRTPEYLVLIRLNFVSNNKTATEKPKEYRDVKNMRNLPFA